MARGRPLFHSSLEWPVETVRETFFSYFGENQHVRLSSTPVIPVDDPKVPLIHTCLNRFKGTLNGRGRHRTRTCFSLRCIIASGDDDVIDHFRNDTTYHRFTEILGSWSFGDYFKEEAIGLLFSLPSKEYKLPQSRIYATYFSGDTSSCLSSDNESKNTLQKYIEEERIVPSMSKCAGPGIGDYSGKIGAADTDGVDTAYRLLADHIRMIAVTNAPGSQLGLGHEGREYFLKCADKQAVQYGHKVLKTNEEDYDVILEGILQNEADLCPELEGYRIMDKIVEDEVMIYKKTIAELQDQELPFDMGEKKKKKKKKDVTSVVWYATRVIEFLGRRTLIILKNKDTRCSLVALCNVLLLGEKITLNLDIKKVSEGHLIYLVQSYLLCGNTQMQLDQNLEL